MRRQLCRALVTVALAAVPILAQAAPAYALAPGSASVVGGKLYFVAGVGVANKVDFVYRADEDRWHVRDEAAPITAGAGCAQITPGVPGEVACTGVAVIYADGGDLNDNLGVRETLAATYTLPVPRPARADAPMWLVGGTGNDWLLGGTGNDRLDGGTGADLLQGGPGIDVVSYADRTRAVSADADAAGNDDGEAGEQDSIYADVENLVGGSAGDTLGGNGGTNVLSGGAGADKIYGYGGSDRLYGGTEFDRLDGGGQGATPDTCSPGPQGANTTDCEVIIG